MFEEFNYMACFLNPFCSSMESWMNNPEEETDLWIIESQIFGAIIKH